MKTTLGAITALCVIGLSGSWLWGIPGSILVALIIYENAVPAAQRPGYGALLRRALPVAARPLFDQTADTAAAARAWLTSPWQDGERLRRSLPAPAAQAARTIAPPASQRVMPTPRPTAERPRWLELINDEPDVTPHALILGASGAGKTTMATAIMADRGGRTMVITPKVAAGGWAGAEVVSLDDDGSYAPIHDALRDLEDEKRRRVKVLRTQGADALEPLTIVLDELVDLSAHAPQALEQMVSLASLGREIKLRLIGIGTTDDALNVRGWKASRNNYVRVEMEPSRRATIRHGGREVAVGARDTLVRAQGVTLRPWRGEPEPAPVPAPATRTTTSLRLTPADLARFAPKTMAKHGVISPPADNSLLAALLFGEQPAQPPATQSVRVDDAGRAVNVYVSQSTAAPTRHAPRRRGGVNVGAMRKRADEYRKVRAVIAGGGSANQAQKAAGIGRRKALTLAAQARTELHTGSEAF